MAMDLLRLKLSVVVDPETKWDPMSNRGRPKPSHLLKAKTIIKPIC